MKKVNAVFWCPLLVVILIVASGLLSPTNLEKAGNTMFSFITLNFGWGYTLIMTSFIVFIVWIGFFSPYRDIKLGNQNEKPEYSNLSWFAMLFSAGMGIGLVFYGVAEPLAHYMNPLNAQPMTAAAKEFAITKSFLHWCLHPWANYCVLGMALCYMQYKRKSPCLISSVFIPLCGEKKWFPIMAKIVDGLAVFATIGGMATSLGLGTEQISSGLNYVFGLPSTVFVKILLVFGITVIFIWTAVSGVNKGIKLISDINLRLVIVLLIGAFILGPSLGILNTLVEGTGLYFQNLIKESFSSGAFDNMEWYGGWTIFYWAWWISWAPFTAIFIARISKGRTIKEFAAGVLFVPTIVSIIWFSIFAGIDFSTVPEILQTAAKDTTTAFFVVIKELPLGYILNIIAIILLFTFFITSANSATFVLGMISEEGKPEPSNLSKFIWGTAISALSLILLVTTENGLKMIQTISIVSGFPFSLIMVLTMIGIVKALKTDSKNLKE
ncbi:BCCT family transporter [Treponema pedis]|uniref:BCCT family transporter n=1 Tax=Treponema pedis TaxID=409322 RepID=UPI00040667EC|nr:BCCT family transporter [Treponema pedis]